METTTQTKFQIEFEGFYNSDGSLLNADDSQGYNAWLYLDASLQDCGQEFDSAEAAVAFIAAHYVGSDSDGVDAKFIVSEVR